MAKKKESGKGYEKVQELAGKAKVELERMLKLIGKEADLSSQFLKNKVNVLGLDTDIEKKYRELGKETYDLIKKGDVVEPKLEKIAGEVDGLYSKLNQAKNQIDKLKEQMKEAVR